MRELALHILDLVENALRAGVGAVRVTLREDVAADRLEIDVEDDGPGLPVAAEQALDPFYTTKRNKRTGLGLSLFQASVEAAGGGLALERSDLGGLRVSAWMTLSHLDRLPLGDLATTLSLAACTNPEVRFTCRIDDGENATEATTRLVPGENALDAARRFGDEIRVALEVLQVGREK